MSELRIAICVPTAGVVPMGFAYSLAGMISKVAAQGIPTRPESQVVMSLDVNESSVWITNREMLVRRSIDNDRTHVMFLDDDMVFEPQVLEILAGRRQPVVTCNYVIKTEPVKDFVAVSLTGKRIPTTAADTGLAPIAYSGFGVSLFEIDVFKKTPQPWFLPEFDPKTSQYTTEDNPCFRRIREAGFPCYVDHDASKLVRHIGRKAYCWHEWKPETKDNASN